MSPAKTATRGAVEIHQRVPAGVSALAIRRWVTIWLRQLRLPAKGLSIATVGPAEIRRLNRTWRRRDRATNVLSFAYPPSRRSSPPTETVWGEILLCPAVIRRERVAYGRSYRDHFLLLLQHGLIHLTGRDHERPTEQRSWSRIEQRLRQLT